MCFAQELRVPQPLCPRMTFAIKQPPWLEGERPPSGVGLQFTEKAFGTWNPVGDHFPVPPPQERGLHVDQRTPLPCVPSSLADI